MSKRPILVYAPVLGLPHHAYLWREIAHLLPEGVVVVAGARVEGPLCWRIECPTLVAAELGIDELVAAAPSVVDSPSPLDRVITNYSILPPAVLARLFSPAFQRQIAEFVREQGVRGIFAQWLDHRVPLLDIADAAGVPYVVRTHGTDICAGIHVPEVRERYLGYRGARAVLAGSEYAKNHLVKIGFLPSQVVVAPFGLDAPSEAPERAAADRVRVLMVSRLVTMKGPMYALEGFRRAAEQRPSLELDIVGVGTYMDAITQLVDAYGLGSRIRLHGGVTNEVLGELWSKADIFLQASFEPPDLHHMETFGVSLLEAMTAGLPIVSSRTQAFPELVHHGVTGVLVPERNAQAIGEALTQLADDAPRRTAMGRAAWARARADYTFALQRQRVVAVLDHAPTPPGDAS